jgi:hypothetical protein
MTKPKHHEHADSPDPIRADHLADPAPAKSPAPAPAKVATVVEEDWQLPEGTTRAVIADGSTVYTLPDGTQRHAHLGQPDRYIFKEFGVVRQNVKELADLIRDRVDLNYSQKVHPDDQHIHAIAVEVAKELGMEPNALNVNHVSGLINQHITAPSLEYPKMKYNHAAKQEMTVANKEEEDALGSEWVGHHWLAPKSEAVAKPEAAAAPHEEAAQTVDDPEKEHAAGKHRKHRAHEA